MSAGADKSVEQKKSDSQSIVEKKVVQALRGKTVSKNYYEILPLIVELQKGQTLGLIIKKDTVVGLKWDSPCLGILQSGDILYSINKEIFAEDGTRNKEMMAKLNQTGGKFTVTVIRFKRRPTIRPFLPKGYQPVEGFEYEWTVLYLMRGMVLGLDVRLIDKKVYVANLLPDSIAAMSLLIGECIIDVEGELITSIPQIVYCKEFVVSLALDAERILMIAADQTCVPSQFSTQMTSSMVRWMDRNGQVRLLVETPANDMLRNMLRAKIAAAVGPPDMKDLPLPPETRPWCEKGLAALKGKDPKPIYREPPKAEKGEKDKKKATACSTPKKKSTTFNEKTVEHSYYDDLQTTLIVKVPPPRTSTDNNPAA